MVFPRESFRLDVIDLLPEILNAVLRTGKLDFEDHHCMCDFVSGSANETFFRDV